MNIVDEHNQKEFEAEIKWFISLILYFIQCVNWKIYNLYIHYWVS